MTDPKKLATSVSFARLELLRRLEGARHNQVSGLERQLDRLQEQWSEYWREAETLRVMVHGECVFGVALKYLQCGEAPLLRMDFLPAVICCSKTIQRGGGGAVGNTRPLLGVILLCDPFPLIADGSERVLQAVAVGLQ